MKEKQMEAISNLLTDMILSGANEKEMEIVTNYSIYIMDILKED